MRVPSFHRRTAEDQRRRSLTGVFTGTCPIREHTADGAYVGRCEFSCYDHVCPRHGWLGDYSNNDDREVDPRCRNFEPGPAAVHETETIDGR